MSTTIRPATTADFDAVRALLVGHHLPLDGVPENLEGFFVADDSGTILGVAGLEFYGRYALLRSVAVRETGGGIGTALIRHALAHADARGIEATFLLTTTAESYFPRFGFVPAVRSEVPEPVRASAEFRGACPASAAVLVRRAVVPHLTKA